MAKEIPRESLGPGKVVGSSDKALEIELEDLGERRWIPRSVIHDDSEVYDEDENKEGEVFVHQWWAVKNGLV